MREIKFRAWDIDNQTMIDFDEDSTYQLEYNADHEITIIDLNDSCEDQRILSPVEKPRDKYLDDCILMQYTGLKDKNGVEIYEGDILRINAEILTIDMPRKEVVVQFKDGSFMYGRSKDPYHMNTYLWVGVNIGNPEVIGNIHTNPELLEKG